MDNVVTKTSFYELLSSQASDALEAQILEDMEHISTEGPVNSQIRDYFHQSTSLMHFSVKDKKLSCVLPQHPDNDRCSRILAYFTRIHEKYRLPEGIEFLVNWGDSFREEEPTPPVPVFAFSCFKPQRTNVCLIPDIEAMLNGSKFIVTCKKYSKDFPWAKKINKGLFLGTDTGKMDLSKPFFNNARVRVVVFSSEHPDLLDAEFVKFHHNAIYSFMKEKGKGLFPGLSIRDHFAYKYLLDVDGNTVTFERCMWILLSNSVLIKVSSELKEWFYGALIPYMHYIPVEEDLSDLQETFYWLQTHDDEAYCIALEGQKLGQQLFLPETIELYGYRLLMAYSEKMQES